MRYASIRSAQRNSRTRTSAIFHALTVVCIAAGVQSAAHAQATYSAGATDLVLLNVLQGPGVVLSNASLEAGDRATQVGVFSNGITGAALEIDSGVVLSTGSVVQAFQTNTALGSSINAPGAFTHADPDLVSIEPAAINDVVVFSFDATLQANLTELFVEFQFGSEEFPDFVGSRYNDIFGFFISGPGISGTRSIGLVPGTTQPISVNNVNGGSRGCSADAGVTTNLDNAAYYINNGHDADTSICNTNPGPYVVHTEYNGVTRRLVVSLNGLALNGTYRFKLAIADTNDFAYDSAVFVRYISATQDPYLQLSKTASPSGFTVGTPTSYTLAVTNTGGTTTAPSVITDTMPAGLTLGTLPVGCSAVGQAVTCTIDAGLAAGSTAQFEIPVTPTQSAMPAVTNTATVSGGGDSECPAAPRCSGTLETPVSSVSAIPALGYGSLLILTMLILASSVYAARRPH